MKHAASSRRRIAIAAWLTGLLLCGVVIARSSFTADLSAFLPKSPTREQQVLLDQLSDGVVSRLMLIGLEGGDPAARAGVSRGMAARLRRDPAFAAVNNGEPVHAEKDRAFLFDNRYLLSAAVRPERFSAEGMRAAIQDSIDLLASPAGMMVRQLLPRDPTGEMVQLFTQLNAGGRPTLSEGAWASRDGQRALLLVQTVASGSDTDGQERALASVRAAFEAAVAASQPRASAVRMEATGPGVFSVISRATIEQEVKRLSVLGTVVIAVLLLLVYRSFTALALGMLPVVSGAFVGVAAVSLGFGIVHGLTLGFGTTLIGEAVDYSIYLFVQSRQADQGSQEAWVRDFWPTIRLGVLTSIAGFASLLLSDFPGLAQLGLYSIAGLLAAAAVTRFVLPHLLPAGFRVRDVSALGLRLQAAARMAPALRLPVLLLALASCALVYHQRASLWNPELAALSPVPARDQAVDAMLRADMGAPDVRSMVVATAASREAALQAAEAVGVQLDRLVAEGRLAAYESPARYLPSEATQRARLASLPEIAGDSDLREAIAGLPVRAEVLRPFVADLAAARAGGLIDRSDLDGTSFALAVDSLLFQRDSRWLALMPLTAAAGSDAIDARAVSAAIAASSTPDTLYVDLKVESDRLYAGYMKQAVLLSLAGVAVILLLLWWSLRSLRAVGRVVLPLAATVAVVLGMLVLGGHKLNILHLIGMLLVVAVGSNYALFFSAPGGGQDAHGGIAASLPPATLTSLAFANFTTVVGFGMLALSEVPVLNAIGSTVGPGAVLALVFAAAFSGRRPRGGG
ncbi:MMPL family transporter [Noviherbaspirillum aridicola]|uniref:Membrane protein n=1 Tax=Noviherbaspirillum aridicola TaxID=2849687 RepID=A0ABQ4Q6C9_9BURK|nr:MMPL family transporter [Noviherbaspirillum aridicola]GIZ52551.1 membrane protein [Noviherbaspirillum aridicola]